MGAHPYTYFVPYEPDINSALQKLRRREFEAGRYNPAVIFPAKAALESPGAQHRTIDDAREAAAEDGTRSILDIDHIADEPEFCAASPLDDETLIRLFGSTKPARDSFEEDGVLELVDRGHALYVITYAGDVPDQIYFAGYSFD